MQCYDANSSTFCLFIVIVFKNIVFQKKKQIQIKTNDDPADFPPRCGFHALALKTFVTTEDTSQSTKNNARRFDI
jgi:hypothetical protein